MFSDGERVACDLPNTILHISPPGLTQERNVCKGLSNHIVRVFSSACTFGAFHYRGPTTTLSVIPLTASVHLPLYIPPPEILITLKCNDIPSIPYLNHLTEYQMIRINHQVSFKKLLAQNSGSHINAKRKYLLCWWLCF